MVGIVWLCIGVSFSRDSKSRKDCAGLLNLKTRDRVGLLVIIVSGLPLSILYKGSACPLG